jgi:hypothetical protein
MASTATRLRAPSRRLRPVTAQRAILAACAFLASMAPARAHIKWFKPYDIHQAPRPIGEVLNQTFVLFFLASVVAIYVFFLVDRYAYRKRILVDFDESLRVFDGLSIVIIRVAAGIFFLSLWAYGTFAHSSFYITPELVTPSPWVPWLQLAIAACALTSRTTPLIGVGILILYLAGIGAYGLYHMLDYLVFLAVGFFLVATALPSKRWKKAGFVTLFAATGVNFLWLAIEKFAYPNWTYPLLQEHPNLLMGMDPAFYMILAGFVEVVIIFTLLGAASIVTRVIAFAFQALFVLAIFEFGLIDAVGHLMIIAILFVLVIRGPTDARKILVLETKSPQMEAYFMTGLYYLAFVNAFLLYYGLHYLLVTKATP